MKYYLKYRDKKTNDVWYCSASFTKQIAETYRDAQNKQPSKHIACIDDSTMPESSDSISVCLAREDQVPEEFRNKAG